LPLRADLFCAGAERGVIVGLLAAAVAVNDEQYRK